MKKSYIIIGIILALIVAVGAVVLFNRNSSAPASTTTSQGFKTYDACQLLTKEKAIELLGTSAILGEEAAPASSNDLKVTNCIYNNDAGNFRDIVSASVLVRAPLTQAGVESNQETFSSSAIVGETPVEGYGEKAFWNTPGGQLNILKDNNWIIVSYGRAQPSSHLLEETKLLADKLFK